MRSIIMNTDKPFVDYTVEELDQKMTYIKAKLKVWADENYRNTASKTWSDIRFYPFSNVENYIDEWADNIGIYQLMRLSKNARKRLLMGDLVFDLQTLGEYL